MRLITQMCHCPSNFQVTIIWLCLVHYIFFFGQSCLWLISLFYFMMNMFVCCFFVLKIFMWCRRESKWKSVDVMFTFLGAWRMHFLYVFFYVIYAFLDCNCQTCIDFTKNTKVLITLLLENFFYLNRHIFSLI